jgi:nucleoside phosphorylase
MIVVTFALRAEGSAFVRKLTKTEHAGFIVRGELVNQTSNLTPQTLSVVHTGVGADECRKRLGLFLASEQPRVVISSGFCGGTSDEVSPGDLVVAENYSDPSLARTALSTLAGAVSGKLYSASAVIDPALDRYGIGREHGAAAIDMETETIARMCAAKSIPMLGLRVVSDSPSRPFPAPPDVLFDVLAQRTNFSRLLGYVSRNPSTVIRLVDLSRQIAMARRKLAEALQAIVFELARSAP